MVATTLVFAASGAVATAAPRQGPDLTGPISATRGSQLAFEASMRSADAQIKSLKHVKRATSKHLKKTRRKLARVKARRSEARERVMATSALIDAAPAELEGGPGLWPAPAPAPEAD